MIRREGVIDWGELATVAGKSGSVFQELVGMVKVGPGLGELMAQHAKSPVSVLMSLTNYKKEVINRGFKDTDRFSGRDTVV